jgi:hypothetical protein
LLGKKYLGTGEINFAVNKNKMICNVYAHPIDETMGFVQKVKTVDIKLEELKNFMKDTCHFGLFMNDNGNNILTI